MAATVFYIAELPESGARMTLDGPEGRHAATVRRIGIGERFLLSDGRGLTASAEVVSVGKGELDVLVGKHFVVPPVTPRVVIAQALPKSERSELAIELATEAGADEFIPWSASRCVAKWQGAKAEKGVARWHAVATAAAKQSRRAQIPVVWDLTSTAQLRAIIAGFSGVVAVLHETGTAPFAELPVRDAEAVLLIVGPEGGVSDEELAMFTDAGARPVKLGPTVLRTSTAAAVAVGALGVLTSRWDAEPPALPAQ